MNRFPMAAILVVALAVPIPMMWCSKADAVAEPVGTCAAEPGDTSISYGDKVQCDLSASTDLDLYRFAGASDERIHVAVRRTSGSNVCISLRRSDGSSTGGDTCTRADLGRNTVSIERDLDETSMHSIVVYGDPVSYTLTLDRVVPRPTYAASICNGCSLEDDLDPHPDYDFVTFEAEAGSRVNIPVARLNGGNVCISLRRSDGSAVGGDTCTRADLGRNTVSIEQALDQDGGYMIFLYGDAVTYRVSLQCLAGSCVPTPTCNGTLASIWGTDGDNVIVGTENRDVISAMGGNDIVYGLGGNDVICGDAGNDIIFGGEGKDRLLGGRGNDMLFGEAGEDKLVGSSGSDVLDGGDDDDNLNGGSNADVCDGGDHIVSDSAVACEVTPNVP